MLALGRKDSGEPLNSEDMALLAAVAGQVATALENGRLYRQLHSKAVELDRLREFNENILESLDDGLVVLDLRRPRSSGGTARSKQLYGVPPRRAVGRPLDDLFDAAFVEARHAARRDAPEGATLYRVPLVVALDARDRPLLVNVADRAAARTSARRSHRPERSSSSKTSPRACSSKSSCRSRRRWRRSACSPPASRTR